jgi:DNA-binding NtrC family response regulator
VSHLVPHLHLIGRSPAFLHVLSMIERVARYQVPVLIQGETGTGKEMAARAVHYLSVRRDEPFVPVNCGALPEALTESELFGCERGAFTDARERRVGLVSAAEGGTLFLDELDALSSRAQVALLRFLQDHSYRPVGSTRERSGDVRVIAAASPRLRQLLASGAFRDDLAFRLGVLVIEMPALRERTGDPLLLAQHFVESHARAYGLAARALHPDSVAWIAGYDWPGNVRELDNLVQGALLLSDDEELYLQPMLSPSGGPAGGGVAADDGRGMPDSYQLARDRTLDRFERDYLEHIMRRSGGNVTHAAQLAGKERRSLGKLLKKHGVDRSMFTATNRPLN